MKSYKMFNGKETTDIDKYIRSWRKVTNKIEKFIGPDCQLTGFDPGLSFALVTEYVDYNGKKISKFGSSFQISKEIAKRIVDGIDKLNKK